MNSNKVNPNVEAILLEMRQIQEGVVAEINGEEDIFPYREEELEELLEELVEQE